MIRFDQFMAAALYDPARGYYTSRIKGVGNRGDFTTSPQLSDSLAKAIAAAFQQSNCRHLIEVGPGTGLLAKQIWQNLSFLTKLRTQQHLVEVSPPLRALQKEHAPKARHHEQIQEALQESGGKAFIYSNELVDAFPARIFRKEESGWSELYLTGSGRDLEEKFLAVEALPDSTLFGKNYPLHQRIEIHESYHHWLREWQSWWIDGQLLTIDYQAPATPLLTGSLRGYFLQDRLTGANLYQNAGHIDLTTDVAFDDLQHWGHELGLTTIKRQAQREFLAPFVGSSLPDQFLIDSQGAGSAFEVLLQRKSKQESGRTVGSS